MSMNSYIKVKKLKNPVQNSVLKKVIILKFLDCANFILYYSSSKLSGNRVYRKYTFEILENYIPQALHLEESPSKLGSKSL